MHMKQHASALLGGKAGAASNSGALSSRNNANRLRVHYLKRFKKASQSADRLLKLADGALDQISLIEIEGYKAQMDAIFSMEKHDYEEAINDLLKAKLIFEQIASYQDTLEAIIYGEKVSQLSTFIRSCATSLSLGDPDSIKLNDADEVTRRIKNAHTAR